MNFLSSALILETLVFRIDIFPMFFVISIKDVSCSVIPSVKNGSYLLGIDKKK
jgi:hypothetical protein